LTMGSGTQPTNAAIWSTVSAWVGARTPAVTVVVVVVGLALSRDGADAGSVLPQAVVASTTAAVSSTGLSKRYRQTTLSTYGHKRRTVHRIPKALQGHYDRA
jgi:hypothetical protein